MQLHTRTDYHATNHLGVTLRTFGDRALAVQWAKDNASVHSGLMVEEVTVTEQRRRVYRPRPLMMAVA